ESTQHPLTDLDDGLPGPSTLRQAIVQKECLLKSLNTPSLCAGEIHLREDPDLRLQAGQELRFACAAPDETVFSGVKHNHARHEPATNL
ncbi:MAG: hypothetical protein KDA89_23955, partial [Planctomycetaceae bacterium]|nr:hypothetical protein [Planctomycetaceae bacterium]